MSETPETVENEFVIEHDELGEGTFIGIDEDNDTVSFQFESGVESFTMDSFSEEDLQELSSHTKARYLTKASEKLGDHRAGEAVADSLSRKASKSGEYSKSRAAGKVADYHFNQGIKRQKGINILAKKLAKEDVQIDELSKKTLGSYIKNAAIDGMGRSYKAGHEDGQGGPSNITGTSKKEDNRISGIAKAAAKLTKEDFDASSDLVEMAINKQPLDFAKKFNEIIENKIADRLVEARYAVSQRIYNGVEIEESEEDLQELSAETKLNYIKKASDDAGRNSFNAGDSIEKSGAAHKRGDNESSSKHFGKAMKHISKSIKRRSGINLAAKKLAKESVEAETEE